ncbi:MAG: T9SS type A sorting domain-containing protein [Bacteroidota bacterium]
MKHVSRLLRVKHWLLFLLFLLVSGVSIQAATFYSQGTDNFSTLSNWNTDPGGLGSNPIATDLTDGTNTFIIQDGHTITIDQDINVAALTVGTGVSGILTFGNDATARTVTVLGAFDVDVGATVNVSNNNATHLATFQGAITNNGTIDLFNSTSQLVSSTFSGTYTIGGANTPEFGTVTFSTGTVTAGIALDINGSVTIETAGIFNDGGFSHTVAGNWTEVGAGQLVAAGTIQFDASVVQSITAAASFNNVIFNGGGIVSLAGNITFAGDFSLTNNTALTTSLFHTISGNFTVADGSSYTATNGRITFNGSAAQTIDIGNNAAFDQVDFDNGGAGNPKTVIGNLNSNDQTRILLNAAVGGTGSHTLRTLIVEGTCDFSGTITMLSGSILNTAGNTITLGTADVIISTGNIAINGDDAVTVNGDLTVTTGNLTVGQNATLIGTAGNTLTIQTGRTITLQGSDNFPTGFGTVVFEGTTSRALYNLNGNQTIRGGITYGELELGGGAFNLKTVDGSLDIEGNLDLNNGIILNLQTFNHTLAGDIQNGSNSATVAISGTFTLDDPDGNQVINATGGSAFYIFGNLDVTNTSPSAVRTKTINSDVTVVGDFTATNTGGSVSNPLVLDINAATISGSGAGTFTLGSNVELRTSGASSFATGIASFTTSSLDVSSIVRFDGAAQDLPGITYGNVEILGNGAKTTTGAMDVNGDFSRTGNTPLLNDGGFNHTVAGDWNMNQAYTTNMTGTITFDGVTQDISNSNFFNVVFDNAGTKTISGEIIVLNDLTINSGVTVDGSTLNIEIDGNWIDAGTFTATTGNVTFIGATANQTITSNATSIFGDIIIDKANASFETVTALTDFNVNQDFDLRQNDAIFDLNGQTVRIGRDWDMETGTTFTANGGTLEFNGNIQQDIFNRVGGTTYFNLVFSGAGEKNLSNNGMNIDGSVTIDNSIFNAGNLALTVAGDWTNTGSFQHTNSLTLDGANQNISASTFHDLISSGSGTKTLSGNVTLDGRFQINAGVTFDVSTSNFNISVEEAWTNNGTFVEQNGTVTLTGGGSTITTGATGPTVGSRFYNLIVNGTGTETISGDLDIENDLTINTGALRTNAFDVFIAGDLTNASTFDHNNNGSVLTFDGTGTQLFNPGGSNYRDITVNGTNPTVTLQADLNNNAANRVITVTNGTFALNSNSVLYVGAACDLIVETNGTWDMDAGSTLQFGRDAIITNAGVFRMVGDAVSPATLTSNDPDLNDFMTFTQTAGTIHAQFYLVERIRGNGIDIQGGALDATNNFSNGSFVNGGENAYLTLTGLDLGAGITITNVIFNTGPSFNCSRTAGNGTVTFQDATGTLAGETFDEDNADPGTLIDFTFPSGFFWDGGAATTAWNDAANWSGNTVPDGTSNVILEHTIGGVIAAYTVEVNTTDGITNRLTLDSEGGNTITLVLNGAELSVSENIQIGSGTILTQTNNTDTLRIAGNWTNEGTFNEGSSAVIFNATSGSHFISTGGSSDPFNDLIIDAGGATYSLLSNLDVDNDIEFAGGSFVVTNQSIDIGGDWTINGGSFTPGTGTVTFDRSGNTTQTINGGTFHDFETDNSGGAGTSTKFLTGSITVNDDLRIRANSALDGGNIFHFVADDWRNDVGISAFTQSGTGTIVFNGAAGQTIGTAGAATRFNNVVFQQGGAKTLGLDMTVNGDITIANNSGAVIVSDGVTVTGNGAANTLSMNGSTLSVRGANNFPTGFETINLSAGEVEYQADFNQTIFPTTYFDLELRDGAAQSTQTKTLIGDIEVTDDIVVSDVNTELDAAGFTITLNDNLAIPTGGTQVAWNGGTLNHVGGGWNIDVDITTFNNLNLLGTGDKNMLNNLTITGDVFVQSDVDLEMQTFTMTATGAGQTFTAASGSEVDARIPAGTGPAFPTGFANYNLDIASLTVLAGNDDKTVFTNGGTISYGQMTITNNGDVTLDGNLDVDGNFLINDDDVVLFDGGFDLNLAGANIDIRTYTATVTSTLTLDGDTQDLDVLNGLTDPDPATFGNLVFSGSGTKTLNAGQALHDVDGNITIDAGVTVTTTRDLFFSGSTFTNNGTYTQTANAFIFDGTNQTVDPGTNEFDEVTFANTGTVSIINNFMNIDDDFIINAGATADFGTGLTHLIASDVITINGTWNTANANLTFDGGGQPIPAITALDIVCAGTGTKTMQGDWNIDDLTVNTGVTLDANNTGNHNITLTGNWIMNGGFQDRNGTVAFESNDTNPKIIQSDGDDFYNVTFNQAQTNTRTYTITQNTEFTENLTIGSGATLDVNGQILTLGNDDGGNPAAETHVVQAGGTLEVDENATLQFNANDSGNPRLTVEGTFIVLGTGANPAIVTRQGGGNRIDIDITTGTIAARFYQFSFLADEGLDIQATATIDPTNNLSDGSWSEINTNAATTRRYLIIESDATGLPDIQNVTFNHGTNPTLGTHFNVQRSAVAVGTITFAGTINGLMGSEIYEDDGDGTKINWPPATVLTWTGAVSTDWHTAGNWSPTQVPTNTNEVVIPLVTSPSNQPIVSIADASCLSLTITDGILTLDAGFDLTVVGEVVIGSGGNGILAVGDPTSNITVSAGWNVSTTGIFANGNSEVTFNAPSGSVTILPRASAFNNLTFNGAASFTVSGDMDVDGDITIAAGTLDPGTNGYNINVAGNIVNTGGSFDVITDGTVTLDGADQSVTDITLDNVVIDGTGTKTMNGNVTFNDQLTVNSIIAGGAGSTIDMNDDVVINASGTFNDGGENHTFSGDDWTGTGAYAGTGTITFDGTNNTDIFASRFNNLTLNGTGQVTLQGDVDMTGNLTVLSTINTLRCGLFLINNTSGTGIFTLDANEDIYVLGANNYPSGFASYVLDPTSESRYEGLIDQTILGGITYGTVRLNNVTTKTLGGNIDVDGLLDINNSTLDVSASNFRINLAGNWDNNDGTGGTFIARQGEVVLDGTDEFNDQRLQLSPVGTNDFYRLTINKPATALEVDVDNNDLFVNENLRVLSGIFNLDGRIATVSGDLTASGGTFTTSGTYFLNNTGGSVNIQMNGSVLANLEINGPGSTFTSLDDLALNGNFTLTAGTFNGNGVTARLGNGADVASISGTYQVGAGGTLDLGNGATLVVNSGGVIEVVGTTGNIATVTASSGGRYNFNVNGTISANNYLFEFMDDNGIFINTGGTIDATNNFSNGTFTNGEAGRTLLRIENNQDLTGSNRIENVSFPENPGGGAFNVTKSTSVAGNIEFFNASGVFSGEDFDNDPNNLIDWLATTTLVWDGSESSDWFDADNWTPAQVPTLSESAEIDAAATNQPVIGSNGAQANNVVLTSGVLTINTADTGIDLDLAGDFTISGTGILAMTSTNDTLRVAGNWSRTGGGLFAAGSGTVVFSNPSGLKTITNGTSPFNNVVISSAGSVQISSDTDVNGDFTIEQGTFDLTTSDFQLSVGGNYINAGGNLQARNGLVSLDASTAGTFIINPGSSSFFDLEVTAGASTTYQLTTNDISVTNDFDLLSGTFDANARTIDMGNGAGDLLTITGTLELDANSTLNMGSNSAVSVNSGGIFRLVGTDDSNTSSVTGQSSGRYSFLVNSGGEIEAQFYSFEFMNTDGIQVAAGATIDATNNFSNGSFSNGATGGRYLLLSNSFADFTISTIVFNSGPSVNIRRVSGSGIVTVEDAFGLLAGEDFEDDSPDGSATTGFLRWEFSNPVLTWDNGGGDQDWHNANNWDDGLGGTGVPNAVTNVFIPNTGFDPIISNADATAGTVNIDPSAVLTINTNRNLTVSNSFVNAGTLTVDAGSATTIEVGGDWSNSGTFNNGGNSTVRLTASTGNINIATGGSAFCTFELNSAAPGDAVFQSQDAIDVDCNFSIVDGTLQITNATHTLNVAGDWNVAVAGSFTNGGSSVILDGTGAQMFTHDSGDAFNDITFGGTGTKTLASSLTITNDLGISSTLAAGTNTITLQGDWTNTGTFTAGTSTVEFISSSQQFINNASGESFFSLTINNSSVSFPQIVVSGPVSVADNATLTMTDGIIETTSATLFTVGDNASLVGGTSAASYISGPMRKVGQQNFTFPVGDGNLFARLAISGLTSSSTFTAEYIDAPSIDLQSVEAGIFAVSGAEHWDLTRDAGTAEPFVTLFWEDGARSEIFNPSSLRVAHYNGAVWENKGNGGTTGSASVGTIVSATRLTSFSPVTFASSDDSNPLPITLNTFTGEVVNGENHLFWETASEINNDFFEIQRSNDGERFEVIGITEGNGTTDEISQYRFIDSNPQVGVNFYRLKQVDFDGTSSFSPIVRLENTEVFENLDFIVYPNPTRSGDINIRLTSQVNNATLSVRLVDAYGREFYNGEFDSSEFSQDQKLESSDLVDLRSGVYFVTIKRGIELVTKKLVIE